MNKLIVILLFVPNLIFAQKLGLGDFVGSQHQKNSLKVISNFVDTSKVVIKSKSAIIMNSNFLNDSIIVTANPYTANSIDVSRKAKKDNHTLHVFSAVNYSYELPYSAINYSDNVLTVIGSNNGVICNQVNHPKIDLVVKRIYGCSTSEASCIIASMCYNVIDTFISVNKHIPYSFETKALLLNTRTSDKYIDTVAAKANVQNTYVDSLIYNQSKSFDIPVNSFYDSVKVTLYYHKMNDDSLSMNDNAQSYSNIEQKTFYNVSNDITINTAFQKGDSLSYDVKQRQEIEYIFDAVVVSDDSIKVLHNATVDFFMIALSDNDTTLMYTVVDSLQQDSVYKIYYIQGDSIRLGDTLHIWGIVTYYDTTYYQNVIKYALSWRYYESQNTLPVELIYFDYEVIDNAVLLKWQTESELNNSHFEVEKSTDGINFEKIGFVQGNGTTLEKQDYIYIDYDIETAFYRLKKVDFDGQFEYSDMIVVNGKGVTGDLEIKYSNIVQNELSVTGDGFARITNQFGQVLKEIELTKSRLITIDVSDFSSGMYNITLVNIDSGGMKTLRFLKQ